jgi:lysyl-tRNA synthetase class 1
MTPPEVLRFIIVKNQPGKHIVFDPNLGILDLVDEYDREERVYFAKEKEIKGMKDLKKTYELSQPHNIPKTPPFQLPYRHLVTLIQIGKNWKNVKNTLIRTGQIPKNLKKEDEEHLKQRIEHVQYWLETFAPNTVKFEVKEKLPKTTLSKEQNIFLSKLKEEIPDLKWEPEAIHNKIYEISEENKIQIKKAFQAMYQIILGQEQGPRAGYFLSNLDKKFVLERLTEAVK